MVARVTTSQRFSVALRNIQASLARTQQVQEQVVTGKQILRPSDDPATRAATAAQVARIRESILELGNTQVGGRYIFAGTAVNPRAFTPDGIYRGNGESLKINLGIATPSTLNVTGSEFLTTGLSPDLY